MPNVELIASQSFILLVDLLPSTQIATSLKTIIMPMSTNILNLSLTRLVDILLSPDIMLKNSYINYMISDLKFQDWNYYLIQRAIHVQ